MISFDLGGRVLEANANFLNAVGYTAAEVVGQHHGMFVDPEYRAGAEYAGFWEALRRGESQAGQFRRIGKGGREVWIEASYNPVLDADGRPVQVTKFAIDVTAQVEQRERVRRLEEEAARERPRPSRDTRPSSGNWPTRSSGPSALSCPRWPPPRRSCRRPPPA